MNTQLHVRQTPAKVNLHLGVYPGVDNRGYHRVDSVMLPITLHNSITLEAADRLSCTHVPALEIAPEKTTAYKAIQGFCQQFDASELWALTVVQHIPSCAGLGSSSADAGCVLALLAEAYRISKDNENLRALARSLGADVSFFVAPELALFEGAGDIHTQSFGWWNIPIVLVMPEHIGGTTPEVYQAFDKHPEEPRSYIPLCEAVRERDAERVGALLYNNLSPVACKVAPHIAEPLRWLEAQSDIYGAQISGSGSCSFALCETTAVADYIASAAQHEGYRAWSCEGWMPPVSLEAV